jgi:thermostable 8-oxoguanine DNA glycosylase
VLKFLRDNGYPLAPKSTPNPKNYGVWETIFLNICKLNYPDQSIADVDLRIWTEYSGRAA